MKKKWLILFACLILVPVVAWIILWAFFLIPLRLPTGPMANTILPGETYIATRNVREIKRGDILVFKFPTNQNVLYTMRVIGLPSETIQCKGRKVFIEGRELPEKRVKIEFAPNFTDSQEAHKELATEGEGDYSVYYNAATWDQSRESQDMKYGVKEPFLIPGGHYFVMGDCRDNSLDSRAWGTMQKDLAVGKVFFLYSSSDLKRNFTKIQ